MQKFQTNFFAKIFFVFLVLTFAAANIDAQSQTKQLFRFAASSAQKAKGKSRAEKSSVAAVREQLIDVQLDAGEIQSVTELDFPLLDGKTYRVFRDSNEGLDIGGAGDATWRGKLESLPDSSVTLTINENAVSGLIYAPSGVYEIVPQAAGAHVLVEINQNLFPECASDDFAGQSSFETKNRQTKNSDSLISNAADSSVIAEPIDSGDRIDVLTLYTPAVKNALGGAAQVEAFLRQAVEITNTAYINSRVRTRLRFVGAAELNYVESGALQTDIRALVVNPTADALRNQAQADLVGLIVNSGDNCGVGSQMSSLNTDFAPRAYSVTVRTCAVGNISFGHELGHNMGLMHDPANATHTPVFPYALGHYVNGVFRTVMSYDTSCPNLCARVPYFSNPNIFYSNLPTGIENARDNARALNNAADTVANFRYSGSSLTLIAPNGGESWQRNVPRRVRWASDNLSGDVKIEISRDGGQNYETLIVATANDGEEIVIFKGLWIKQARIRVSSLSNAAITDSSVAAFSVK